MKSDSANKLVKVTSVIEEIYGGNLHKKRQQSLAYAAMGVLASESLFLHQIAEGMVDTRGVKKKHATKQIDRLLSNKGVSVWDLSEAWVKYVIGENKTIRVALDWSSFFDDEQSTLSLNIVTGKGLSTPLLWKSMNKNQLKHNRARYEDQLLSQLKMVLSLDVMVILLADRGFTDQKFFRFLEEELHFKYIIRIKSSTTVIHKEIKDKAANWLKSDGKLLHLKEALLTLEKYPIKQFVAVKDKNMKAAWFLAIVSPFLRPLLGHPSPQKGQKLSTSMPAAALAVLRTLVMTRLGVITSLPQMTCRPCCGPYILPSAKHPVLRSTRDYRPRSFVASLADSVSNTDFKGSEIVKHYSKRWKIEPYFRDLKNSRFGWGLESTHIKSCERRDKLMLILALSYTLLTILGEAGEVLGFDKKLKVNTVKTRTHSLFRQGQFYYKFFFRFPQNEQEMLMGKFQELLT